MKKIDILTLVSMHNECKEWFLEIEAWQDRIQFIRDLLIRFSNAMEDKNRVLKVQTFYNELDSSFKSRLDWLIQKLEIHKEGIQSFFKKNHVLKLSDLIIQHDAFGREVMQLQEEYAIIRASFFDLVKPVLNKKRLQKQPGKAA